MKLIKQLIEKKIENKEILSYNRKRESSFAEHISAYMMALSYLDEYDESLQIKIRLWRKFISAEIKEKEKYYKKLLVYMLKENNIIIRALDKIENEKINDELYEGSLYIPGSWGILSFEFSED